jgi:hypothetical protein
MLTFITIFVKLKKLIPHLFNVPSHDNERYTFILEKVRHEENKIKIVQA